jgi:hypothetical protein
MKFQNLWNLLNVFIEILWKYLFKCFLWFFKFWWVQENQNVMFPMVPPKDGFAHYWIINWEQNYFPSTKIFTKIKRCLGFSAFERDMKLFNYKNIKNKLFTCCQFHQKIVRQQFCEFEKKIEHNWFWKPP